MKLLTQRLMCLLIVSLYFTGCGDIFSSRYFLTLPQAPEPWIYLMDEPNWRLEWLDKGGQRQIADILPGQNIEIEFPVTWTNPVTAWPYWPAYNLPPGLFKPAGALFPFDVSGEYLRLSWEAGPDTVFYWELALAYKYDDVKIPANFDWSRFRELFKGEILNEAVREDPWLIGWRSVAERTVDSNFDRRRLVPQAVESVVIPLDLLQKANGPWFGGSPFAEPLFFVDVDSAVFPVRSGVNVWISAGGILRCTNQTWVFTAWE